MNREDFIALYKKYTQGPCSAEEKQRLREYWQEFRLDDKPWDEKFGIENDIKESIFERIKETTALSSSGNTRTVKKLWYYAAAAVVGVLLIGSYIHLLKPMKQSTRHIAKASESPIVPGKNKATLTLADGSTIQLDDTQNGTIANEEALITKDEGRVVYKAKDQKTKQDANIINTLHVPKGGEYQLELADGTKVWLNAGSTLSFPSSFANLKERVITLAGEAYFEVAKRTQQPFVVRSEGSTVQVLGTSFNIKAYPEESLVQTTLLSGSVVVKEPTSANTKQLYPNQQAVVQKNRGNMQVRTVNPADIISWKNGYFIFDNQSIQQIMPVIERWYDVEVSYQQTDNTDRYGGTFSRNANLQDILRDLTTLGNIRFKLQGRKLIVMDNNEYK